MPNIFVLDHGKQPFTKEGGVLEELVVETGLDGLNKLVFHEGVKGQVVLGAFSVWLLSDLHELI